MNTGVNKSREYFFGINKKSDKQKMFEMEELYLNMIRNTKKELIITMAYFSHLDNFYKEIVDAYKRGVKIKIMIPNSANYQDDTNKRTVKKLMKECNDEIEVYLSNKMVHTKMIISDEYISLGSTNITKKAFNQLDELNLFIKNVKSTFKDELEKSIDENYKLAKRIKSYKEIEYNKVKAKIESFLV
jgi:cardiolipin synthase